MSDSATISSSYDSLDIAYGFMERARHLADLGKYDEAHVALDKAKTYAFNNISLLDDIRIRREAISEARRQYIKNLEEEVADIFSGDRFDGQTARELLQALLREDSSNELAKSLWAELPAKEAAERERRLVEDFQRELDKIWKSARKSEDAAEGTRAVEEYERALAEASKKAGNSPDSIPLQRLKKEAAAKRDRAKDKWIGIPTLIADQKGRELVERYEALQDEGEVETEFFDREGEFLGKLPIDECIDKAKEMASVFADQKAQDYLGQAQTLLEESPGAARDKVQDALSLAYLSDFTKNILEQELEDKIEPAIELRQKALDQLKIALSKPDPEEAWLLLRDVEQMDLFTPGLEDARQRLTPMMHQKFIQFVDAGQRLQEFEDFEAARVKLQEAIDVAKRFFTYGEEFQELYPKAQEAFDQCIQAEKEVEEFDRLLQEISIQSETEPELAKEQLKQLAGQDLSPQALAKIDRLRVQVDVRLGVEQLFGALEQKMLSTENDVELIPIEEAANQATQKYPHEERFQRLVERIIARRSFLRGRRLKEDPERRLEAEGLLQEVINRNGDDALVAQALIDEIAADEEQEADIDIAIHQADDALSSGDARLAFLILEPYRYAVSRQASQIRQLISTAVAQWHDRIDQQLEALINAMDFSLPKVEQLLGELERSQSPRLEEWKARALAPAYANAAEDLQELNRWDRADELWEEAFRLAPSNPMILEGRRNSQKQRALIQAQMTSDPVEKEQILNDLNNTYADDLTIKRYLAEFYYAQERYVEARMAVSQAMFLSQHAVPELTGDVEAIHRLDSLIQEMEKIEKRKLAIQSRIAGRTTIGDLWEARMACEQLIQDCLDHAEKMASWWKNLIEEPVERMKARISELSEEAGTAWERTELLCKILALQADVQVKERAERTLRLTYNQLPSEVQSVVDNPDGAGYGSAAEALTNHIAKASDLYGTLINISQVERISSDLGITPVERTIDLDSTLYDLELTLDRLRSAQKKQREVRSQIVIAMMTGEWESIDDSLQEVEQMGLSEHRGLKGLAGEVQRAKNRRAGLESVVKQIKDAVAEEEFNTIQERMEHMAKVDPTDETRLRSTLEVVDPYTNLRVKGHRELGSVISEKLTVLKELTQWREDGKPAVDWQAAHSKIAEFTNSGAFADAIGLCQAVAESNDTHQPILNEESWSLGHRLQFLKTPPISREHINSARAQALLDQADQEIGILTDQINESESLVKELERNKEEFSQILSELKPLLEQLNEASGFWSSLFKPSAEIQKARAKALGLLERGRRLCPDYPGFENLERNPALRR